ncbi:MULTISPECIES: YybH family protein [Dermacoccus]|uniref:DUF4440 domain-containing protein n=1 Tax=Dermacoccus profundi TaxID=322602 RepID=A0ABN2D741_9MICO|nr:hypothetical protein [Dermacoccus abyssi]
MTSLKRSAQIGFVSLAVVGATITVATSNGSASTNTNTNTTQRASANHPRANGVHGETATTETPSATAPRTDAAGRLVARTPQQLLKLLGERIVAKDVDGIVALQEPRAAIIDWDLKVIRGRANIRTFYVDWFKSNPVLTVNPQQNFVSGGQRQADGTVLNRTASIMGTYSLTQDDGKGGRTTFTGNFCDIVRQQPDGTWLYLQDNPYPPHGSPSSIAGSGHH